MPKPWPKLYVIFIVTVNILSYMYVHCKCTVSYIRASLYMSELSPLYMCSLQVDDVYVFKNMH